MLYMVEILNIKWFDRISNEQVLQQTKMPSIDSLLTKAQLRWTGHIVRMEDTRLPKQIFYSELSEGQWPRGRPCLRYKDTLKRSLKKCNISVDQWENMANDRSAWPTATHKAVESFEHERRSRQVAKRAARKARADHTQHSIVCPDLWPLVRLPIRHQIP